MKEKNNYYSEDEDERTLLGMMFPNCDTEEELQEAFGDEMED